MSAFDPVIRHADFAHPQHAAGLTRLALAWLDAGIGDEVDTTTPYCEGQAEIYDAMVWAKQWDVLGDFFFVEEAS